MKQQSKHKLNHLLSEENRNRYNYFSHWRLRYTYCQYTSYVVIIFWVSVHLFETKCIILNTVPNLFYYTVIKGFVLTVALYTCNVLFDSCTVTVVNISHSSFISRATYLLTLAGPRQH